MFSSSRRTRSGTDIWPGYVDVLATLLMLFVFVLTLFMVAQFVLTDALSGRDRALERLESQLSDLGESLSMARAERDSLAAELDVTLSERDDLRDQLSDALTDSERLMSELESAGDTMDEQRGELASLQQDIAALRELRAELEGEIAELAGTLAARDEALAERDEELEEVRRELGAERDRSMALEAELADQEERTLLAQREIEERETRVRDLQALTEEQRRALEEEQELSEAQIARIDRLNRQVTALREQLRRVAAALELSQEEVAERDVRIEELGRELNLALVDEVRELSRYRSEFFGRLREILGDRDDIQIVGDRFRFQSELFFGTAEAEIGGEGRGQLDDVARTLLEIAEEIDDNDIPWILQVEGHTDRRQIRTEQFPSNWQLSTARAQSIVDYLIDQGVPPERLSATGFAEFHPIDEGDDAEALSRNRRIELRITSR